MAFFRVKITLKYFIQFGQTVALDTDTDHRPALLSHLHGVLQSPDELGAVAQPVDDVEDEEGERHRHQEEPVSRDVVWTTELLCWLF